MDQKTINNIANRAWTYGSTILKNLKFWPPQPRTFVATGIFGVMYGGYKAYNYQQEWQTLTGKIAQFQSTVKNDLAKAAIFSPADKLYLMHTPGYNELQAYPAFSQELATFSQESNDYSKKLAKFSWLKNLPYFDFKQNFDDAVSNLSSTNQLIEFSDNVNTAQHNLKRRLYKVAENSINNALDCLDKNPHLNLEVELNNSFSRRLTHNVLLAHSHNLAAKIARATNDLEKSDYHYEQALTFESDSLEILGSQIALWGDMAWDKPKPEKLNNLLSKPEILNEIAQRFEKEKYALGLANLSWLFIRAYMGVKDEVKKQELMLKAHELADKAVKLSGLFSADQTTKKKLGEKDNVSINSLLFRGITAMDLGDPKDACKYFLSGLSYQPHHISLLRRYAWALEQSDQIVAAYWAYQRVRIQLHYQKESSEGLTPQQKTWLDGVESKLPTLEQKLQQQLKGSTWQVSRKFSEYLIKGNIAEAYQLLSELPEQLDGITIKTNYQQWFMDHYKISRCEQTPNFMPKSNEELLVRLDLYHQPTPYTFIALSSIAYQTKAEQLDPVLPPGWELIGSSARILPESRTSGYLAFACKNKTNGAIVIVHAGTDVYEMSDLVTDLKLAWGQGYSQLEWARMFTEQVMKQQTNKGLPQPLIYHTGHSLGGAISGYLACVLNPAGQHYAVTFDNPSPYWALIEKTDTNLREELFRDDKINEHIDFPITTFLMCPSFINTAGGPHLGQVYCLPTNKVHAKPLSELTKQSLTNKLSNVVKGWFKNWLEAKTGISMPQLDSAFHYGSLAAVSVAYHDKTLIQKTFVEEQDSEQIFKSPTETYAVNAWPEDISAWLEFERQLGNDLPARLAFKPKAAQMKVEPSLFAVESIKAEDTPKEFHEKIPLSMFPKNLRNLLEKYLTKEEPNQEEEYLLSYFDKNLLSLLKLDSSQKNILIKTPINSWQLTVYFRQQIFEAINARGTYAFSNYLYPHLSKLAIAAPRFKISQSGFFAGAITNKNINNQEEHKETANTTLKP